MAVGSVLDRSKFDLALIEEARKYDINIFDRAKLLTVTKSLDSDVAFRLKIHKDDVFFNIGCNFLVDATGRLSYLARLFGARRQHFDRLVALVGILKMHSNCQLSDNAILIEPFENGWWYSTKIAGNKMIASAYTDSDLFPHETGLKFSVWKNFLLQAPSTKQRLKDYQLESICLVAANSSILSVQ